MSELESEFLIYELDELSSLQNILFKIFILERLDLFFPIIFINFSWHFSIKWNGSCPINCPFPKSKDLRDRDGSPAAIIKLQGSLGNLWRNKHLYWHYCGITIKSHLLEFNWPKTIQFNNFRNFAFIFQSPILKEVASFNLSFG